MGELLVKGLWLYVSPAIRMGVTEPRVRANVRVYNCYTSCNAMLSNAQTTNLVGGCNLYCRLVCRVPSQQVWKGQ